MQIGEAIGAIRKNKNLKSKDIYKGILSRPAISRFEKGHSDTTAEKFFQILDNLNLSLEEFHFLSNNKANTDAMMISTYSEAYYAKDLLRLAALEEKAKNRFEETSKIKYLHHASIIHLLQCNISELPFPHKELAVIKDYLFQCETWHYYELVLFTNSLDFFPEDVLDAVYARAKEKMTEFNRMKSYQNELFSLISNILVLQLGKNNLEKSWLYYADLEKTVSASDNRMYEHAMLLFFKELIAIMQHKEDTEKLTAILQTFNLLNMERIGNQCAGLLEIVRKNNA
ncbi:helix-turn-helix domain-containing protein [uncultured Trichococcus sp.]|uniref:helix-turn-helix domain-containing protein n=1 Tax=uncultured Trichococcus sp. TaxID=189665 RepID=UPI002A18E8F4|nr:helix-turn-helix domain-containing protein [uncultured Trichococcus sp.]